MAARNKICSIFKLKQQKQQSNAELGRTRLKQHVDNNFYGFGKNENVVRSGNLGTFELVK